MVLALVLVVLVLLVVVVVVVVLLLLLPRLLLPCRERAHRLPQRASGVSPRSPHIVRESTTSSLSTMFAPVAPAMERIPG